MISSSPPARPTPSAISSIPRSLVPVSIGMSFVEIDPRYFRPTEVDYLMGDPSKANAPSVEAHGQRSPIWCDIMVDQDIELAKQEADSAKGRSRDIPARLRSGL